MRFLAIVHDLDQTPSWKSEWIEIALSKVFEITGDKSLSAIGIPVLESQFGHFKLEEFVSIFVETLKKQNFEYSLRIWLVVKPEDCHKTFELLKAFEPD